MKFLPSIQALSSGEPNFENSRDGSIIEPHHALEELVNCPALCNARQKYQMRPTLSTFCCWGIQQHAIIPISNNSALVCLIFSHFLCLREQFYFYTRSASTLPVRTRCFYTKNDIWPLLWSGYRIAASKLLKLYDIGSKKTIARLQDNYKHGRCERQWLDTKGASLFIERKFNA